MTIEDDTGPERALVTPVPGGAGPGWWPSPWTAAQVAAGKVSRGGLGSDRGLVVWTEGRPDEGGRQVVVAVDAAGHVPPVDRSPVGTGVRSRVHEY
ncbi:MAG TPA: hypothetical protein VFC03_06030, partial [Acidimicrobiales bacterium]|nr:hypothetical protein [Acidimicrobiales bacterium]